MFVDDLIWEFVVYIWSICVFSEVCILDLFTEFLWKGWSFHVGWFYSFAGWCVAFKFLVEICYFIIDEEHTESGQDCISMLEFVSICLISEVVILVSLFAELIVILFCELRKVTVIFGLAEWSLMSLTFILDGLLDQLMIILPLEWRCC